LRQLNIDDLDIADRFLPAESDGVYGNALATNLVDGRQIDSAGAVRPIAEQNYCTYGQTCRFADGLFKLIIQMRCRRRGSNLIQIFDSLQFGADFVQSHLELLFEILEHASV